MQYNKDIDSLSKQDTPTQDSTQPEPKKKRLIVELLVWAGITISIVLIIQNFIFQAFYVSGSSMEPGFSDNDYLIISKIPLTQYNLGKFFGQKNVSANRGDVVVFRYPNAPETFFVKRIIGLPGDRVVLKDGVYTIYNTQHPDGLALVEDYVDPQYVTQGNIDEVVEEGKLFVSGDNRSPGGSFDSREWGQLPQEDLTGFAVLRLLPINTLKFITGHTYPNN
jgi:signal peptidase I